jgi:hypothetical protein
MHQSRDTFMAMLDDGSFMSVAKGDYLPDGHELVKRDQDPDKGSGGLFKHADFGEDERPPAKSLAPKAPAAKAPLSRAGGLSSDG